MEDVMILMSAYLVLITAPTHFAKTFLEDFDVSVQMDLWIRMGPVNKLTIVSWKNLVVKSAAS